MSGRVSDREMDYASGCNPLRTMVMEGNVVLKVGHAVGRTPLRQSLRLNRRPQINPAVHFLDQPPDLQIFHHPAHHLA